jgi:HK97 family phage prohead protease
MNPKHSPTDLTITPLASSQGLFQGYASTFSLDKALDRIMPGAFTKTLEKDWLESKGHLPYLFLEHDPYQMVGLCTKLYEDAKGLFIQGRLLMEIPSARQAYQLLRQGIQGLSIGFVVKKASMQGPVRHIHELSLKEISIVSSPCNDQARIQEYKKHGHDTG